MTGNTGNAVGERGKNLTDLERVRLALERIVGESVVVISRAIWDTSLREGGEPTRLPGPFAPHERLRENPDFQMAVASGMPHAPEGLHYVRRDEKDAPMTTNLDSFEVVVDLVGHALWPEVLRVAGLDAGEDLVASVRENAFVYRKNRHDHHSPTIPEDIDGAEPKEDAR